MNPQTKRHLLDLLIIILLTTAVVLLFINYKLIGSEGMECIQNTKIYLIRHFEELTGGNVTCTCLLDRGLNWDTPGGGNKIIFSSWGVNEGSQREQLMDLTNLTINP